MEFLMNKKERPTKHDENTKQMNGLVVWDDFICSAESLELKKIRWEEERPSAWAGDKYETVRLIRNSH